MTTTFLSKENKRDMKIYHSDCLKILKKMPTNSVDSIVTDPPYGIFSLDCDWDKSLPSTDIWRECFRVLRPGGYLLAFASARRYHDLAHAMEKVGFETQNMLVWLYGNGFPRGINLSYQFDRSGNLPRPNDKFRAYLRKAIKRNPYKIRELEEMCGTNGMFSHYLGRSQPAFPSYRIWKILKKALKLDSTYDSLFRKMEEQRKKFKGNEKRISRREQLGFFSESKEYQPKSSLAKKWMGWRYGRMALRPSLEPIYFGQKPPLRPMTENIKAHGLGALNVEGCKAKGRDGRKRYPGNALHDGSANVLEVLNRESERASQALNEFKLEEGDSPFFYVPKPNRKEREGNTHPTVKPISLMRQLVRLITPLKGLCLDPFMGSGTTGVACLLERLEFIGIEKEREFYQIAKKRIKKEKAKMKKKEKQEVFV